MNSGMNLNMGNLSNKMMDNFFRKVDGVKWDLLTGRVGVQVENGIASLEGEGDDASISISLFDQFGMEVPAFAQNTPIESVTDGDLIYQNGKIKGWVTNINRTAPTKTTTEGSEEEITTPGVVKSFGLLTPSGMATTWKAPKLQMFGLDSGVMVARSLMNMLPGGQTDLNNMSSFMPMMMAMGGGNMDMDNMMPMMLFSQLGASGTGEGAMGLNSNMMQTMMMMSMFSGGGGMGNMFGGGSSNQSNDHGYFDKRRRS